MSHTAEVSYNNLLINKYGSGLESYIVYYGIRVFLIIQTELNDDWILYIQDFQHNYQKLEQGMAGLDSAITYIEENFDNGITKGVGADRRKLDEERTG